MAKAQQEITLLKRQKMTMESTRTMFEGQFEEEIAVAEAANRACASMKTGETLERSDFTSPDPEVYECCSKTSSQDDEPQDVGAAEYTPTSNNDKDL